MRWFLSYHSPDQALAERLKAAIERKDSNSRVFFAPTSMRASGAWTAQLAQELAGADAFIFLVGDAGVGNWQVPEYDEALDRWVRSGRTFPLIVIVLEGQKAPGLPFLRQLHWIVTADPASETDLGRLFDAVSGHGSRLNELWRYTSPYRGLESMEEKDSDYFFGRTQETLQVLDALAAPDRLPVLIGNSGVGKSSLAKAGVLAALKRQAWPELAGASNSWPAVFQDSRQWCFLSLKPGTDPLKALVESFVDTWQFSATDPVRADHQHGWIERLGDGKATLSDLIEATERRRAELEQTKPPGFFLYVDQGEELYVRAEEGQRRRFSLLLAEALADPRLRTMISMRADFLGALQSDKPLFKAHQQINVPPLSEHELREVVSRPAQLLGARFEPDGLIDIITQRTAEDSIKDVGALPLLSYTLDDMWREMTRQGDGRLRLPAQSFELGGVLVGRANRFLAEHKGAEDALRRVFTLRLATVREDGEPTRRRAPRGEFSSEEWRLVSDLADYPNRLLVTATTASGDTYAEVAHEALFRRWHTLRDWIASEREFLIWRDGLEAARRAWEGVPHRSKSQALLMGFALMQAQGWLARRYSDIHEADREFVLLSRKNSKLRRRRVQALVGVLLLCIVVGVIGWMKQSVIQDQWHWYTVVRPFLRAQVWPYVLDRPQEQDLKVGESFRDCAQEAPCPDLVVVPSGSFMMGAAADEPGRTSAEEPDHKVTIAKRFAVSKYEITFAQWDACASYGDCDPHIRSNNWGRSRQPIINVNWNDAQRYVAWLSRITGKHYRLLSEAEYEYAARAGTRTAFPWGQEVGHGNANCDACGSKWDAKQPAPVGSFPPNKFGLFDMVGNVWEWVADCAHVNYDGAPDDGSPWEKGDSVCGEHVVRGGSWVNQPGTLRSASRDWFRTAFRDAVISFRVARTLAP